MVDGKRVSPGLNSVCHETLRFGIDHAVFFCDQKPGSLRSPNGFWSGLLDALECDRPLYCFANCNLLCRGMMREGIGEPFVRHPDPSLFIRSQLGCLRMSFVAVKHLTDSFPLIRSKC